MEAVHVDGTMGVQERNKHLAWLKADPAPGTARVLTNAHCLSEGVDVPAFDAVMFLTPRGSHGNSIRLTSSGIEINGADELLASDLSPGCGEPRAPSRVT